MIPIFCVYTQKKLLSWHRKACSSIWKFQFSPWSWEMFALLPTHRPSSYSSRAVCSPFTSPLCHLKWRAQNWKQALRGSLAKAENNGMTISFVLNAVTLTLPERPAMSNAWLKPQVVLTRAETTDRSPYSTNTQQFVPILGIRKLH